MIKILVMKKLREEIYKTFKKESPKIFSLIKTLQKNPQKGKILGNIGNMSIRELKYKTYRFYFLIDGHKLYLFTKDQTTELLIRFIKMSKKNNQQKTITRIKQVLKFIGEEGFDK